MRHGGAAECGGKRLANLVIGKRAPPADLQRHSAPRPRTARRLSTRTRSSPRSPRTAPRSRAGCPQRRSSMALITSKRSGPGPRPSQKLYHQLCKPLHQHQRLREDDLAELVVLVRRARARTRGSCHFTPFIALVTSTCLNCLRITAPPLRLCLEPPLFSPSGLPIRLVHRGQLSCRSFSEGSWQRLKHRDYWLHRRGAVPNASDLVGRAPHSSGAQLTPCAISRRRCDFIRLIKH